MDREEPALPAELSRSTSEDSRKQLKMAYCHGDADNPRDWDFEDEIGWNDPAKQLEHACQGCGTKFKAHESRGKLAYCDSCADRIKRGEDIG